ncbi:hypothetical protein [Streptomyces sp. NPDC048473]
MPTLLLLSIAEYGGVGTVMLSFSSRAWKRATSAALFLRVAGLSSLPDR